MERVYHNSAKKENELEGEEMVEKWSRINGFFLPPDFKYKPIQFSC
jgi:hypothetical protein